MSDQHRKELRPRGGSAELDESSDAELSELDRAHRARASVELDLARVTAERDGLLDLVHDGIWLIDSHGRTIKTNARLAEILGTTSTELSGQSLPDFVAPADRDDARELLQNMLSGERDEATLRLRRDDGAAAWVAIRAERYDGGATLAVSDQTDAVDATRDLRVAEADLAYERTLLDAVGEALMAFTADGRITYFNPAAEELSGWRSADVVGRPLEQLVPPHVARARVDAVLAAISSGERFHGEVDGWSSDESHVPMSVTLAPVLSRSGAPLGMVAVASNLTAQRQAQLQLRQAQRLEALGRLVAGVAHDFNNLLTTVQVNAEMLRTELFENPRLEQIADEVLSASLKGAELTRQLLTFGREAGPTTTVVRLADIVEELLALLRRLLPESIELVTALGEDSGYVEADPTQVAQLLMNLVVNARDAMPHGGVLQIGVQSSDTAIGQFVTLVVKDDGIGMDEATLSRIFEPFFTTKGDHGTGLGLSTVFGIVRQNEGAIRIGSEVGRGSIFAVDFPQVRPGVPADIAEPEPRSTNARVIVCEDERPIRRLVGMVLRQAGYEVMEAADAEAALEIADGNQFDLIITDLQMPGMNGHDLIDRLRADRPHLRVVMMSGYASFERAGVDPIPNVEFICKPFRPDALLATVATALDD